MKRLALLLPLLALALPALAQDPATQSAADNPHAVRAEPTPHAETVGPEAMAGAKAVLAAALRAPAKTAPASETNDWTRYAAAMGVLVDRQVEGNGAVPAADWLAAVDCALRLPADDPRKSVRDRLDDLLKRFPGPRDWDAVRAGLRERADAAADASPPAGPWLLPALRTVADFLGGGGRGVPEEAFAPFAAAAAPEGVDPNRLDRARDALRRAMERPGEPAPAPFSLVRFERRLDRALRGTSSDSLVWPAELEALPDETLAPLLRRALSGAEYHGRLGFEDLSSGLVARLVASALADPAACSPEAWSLAARPETDGRALFDALVAAHDPLGAIRRRMSEAAADAEDDAEDGLASPRAVRPYDVFRYEGRNGHPGRYASALLRRVRFALDDGRLDEAEALAAPLRADDWPAILFLAGDVFVPQGSHGAWRSFLEPRLPEGADLPGSPLLKAYDRACLAEAPGRYLETVRARLGATADTPAGTNALADFRTRAAKRVGDLDAVEAAVRDEIARPDGSLWDYGAATPRWLDSLAAMGETARLSDALDRVLARLAEKRGDDRGAAPFWAVRHLAALGRFAEAEAILRDALGADPLNFWDPAYERGTSCEPAASLVWLYARAGRPRDALEFAAGWPRWWKAEMKGDDRIDIESRSVPATVAGALAAVGRGDGAAFARFVAEKTLCARWLDDSDWPYETLLAATTPAETLAFLDGLLRIDPFDDRLWRWRAEALRRAGDLAAAEAAARRAVELQDYYPSSSSSWRNEHGDELGRGLETLAAVLEERGGADAPAASAALRRAATAARLRAAGTFLWEDGYRTNAVRRYEAAARLADGAPALLRWCIACDLFHDGVDGADALAESALRDLAARGGRTDPVWFGSGRSEEVAGLVLPALAAAPDAGATAHCLAGRLHQYRDEPEEAFAEYGRAHALDPGDPFVLIAMLDLRREVERPAAEWGALQASLRRLDPCCRHHSEEARRIVDWPALWRAYEEAGAGASLARAQDDTPFFRLEAAARIEEAKKAAEKAASAAIAAEAGADAAAADDDDDEPGDERRRTRNVFAESTPAAMLPEAPWCRRLLDLASVLSGDRPRDGRAGDDPFRMTGGSACDAFCIGGDDDYFYDEW